MMGFCYLYAKPAHKQRFETMLHYLHGLENDVLRKRFDEYMIGDNKRQAFGAANCFFTAVNGWCGLGP